MRLSKISPHGPHLDPHTALLKEKGVLLDARIKEHDTNTDDKEYLDPFASRVVCPENRPTRLKPLDEKLVKLEAAQTGSLDYLVDFGIESYKNLAQNVIDLSKKEDEKRRKAEKKNRHNLEKKEVEVKEVKVGEVEVKEVEAITHSSYVPMTREEKDKKIKILIDQGNELIFAKLKEKEEAKRAKAAEKQRVVEEANRAKEVEKQKAKEAKEAEKQKAQLIKATEKQRAKELREAEKQKAKEAQVEAKEAKKFASIAKLIEKHLPNLINKTKSMA